jgi:hypothetical protein
MRLHVDADGTVHVADDVFASNLVVATHLGDAWVFVTHAGEVFRATTALGELTPVGTLGGHHAMVAESHLFHIALIDERSHLFLVDAERVREVEGTSIDAAFPTATFGVRLALGGDVLRTTDAGATWSPVVGPWMEPPYAAYHIGHTLILVGERGAHYCLGEDGAATACDPPETPEGAPTVVREAVDHFIHAPRGLAAPITASGRALIWDGVDHVRLADGGVRLELPSGCHVSTWGERFVARCGDETRIGDGQTPFAVSSLPRQAWLDPAGERFVMPGACEAARHTTVHDDEEGGDQERDDESEDEYDDEAERSSDGIQTFCVHDADGTTRALGVGDGCASSVFTVAPGHLVASIVCSAEPEVRLVAVDLATGELRDIPLVVGEVPMRLRAAADGTLTIAFMAMREGSLVSEWRVGRVDAPFRSLADVAGDVYPLDARHFVADGDGDEGPVLSDDGGTSFHVIAREMLGAYGVRADLVTTPADQGDFILIDEQRFGAASADFMDWVWMRADVRGFVTPPLRHIDGPSLSLLPTLAPLGQSIRADQARFLGGHPFVSVPAPVERAHLMVAGGWVRIEAPSPTTELTDHVNLDAGGDDGARFHWTARVVAPPMPVFPGGGEVSYTRVVALGITRALAAFMRCTDANRREVCDVLVVRASGEVSVIAPADVRTPWVDLPTTTMVLDRGGLAVFFDGSHTEMPASAILEIAADGASVLRSLHTGPVAARRSLARGPDGHATFLVERGDDAWLVVDGALGPRRSVIASGPLAPCGAVASDAIEVVVRATSELGYQVDSDETLAVASDGHACLRSASARNSALALGPTLRGAPIARVVDGALSCTLLGADGHDLALPCALVETLAHEFDAGSGQARRPRVAHLADGTLVAALEAGHGDYAILRLGEGGWTRVTTLHVDADDEYPRPAGELIEGGDAVELLVRGGNGARVVNDAATTAIDAGVRFLLGGANARTTLSSTESELTVAAASGHATSVTLAHPLVQLRMSSTSPSAVGVVVTSDDDSGGDYISSEAEHRVLALTPRGPTLSAPLAVTQMGEPRWASSVVVGGTAAHPLALVYRYADDDDDNSHRSLVAQRVDAHRATPIGSPIEPSMDPGALIVPLAVLDAPVRVVWGDTTQSIGTDVSDVRVATLRGREWVDVAPAWPMDGDAVTVAIDHGEVVVLSVSGRGVLRSARLHGSAWVSLAAPTIDQSADDDED